MEDGTMASYSVDNNANWLDLLTDCAVPLVDVGQQGPKAEFRNNHDAGKRRQITYDASPNAGCKPNGEMCFSYHLYV